MYQTGLMSTLISLISQKKPRIIGLLDLERHQAGIGGCRKDASLMMHCFIPLRTSTINLTLYPGCNARSSKILVYKIRVFSHLFDLFPGHVMLCGAVKLNDRDGLGSEIGKESSVRLSRQEISDRGYCVVLVNSTLSTLHDRLNHP
jgi:hypothetical protein